MNHNPDDPPKGKRPLHINEAKIKTLEVSEAEDTHRLDMSNPATDPAGSPRSPSDNSDPRSDSPPSHPGGGSPRDEPE